MAYGIIHEDILCSSLLEELDPELKIPLAFHVFMVLCVLADSRGEVHSTPEALARRMNFTGERFTAFLRALAVLEAPDPRSRSPEEGGRRILRLGGRGWRIVNYLRYAKAQPDFARRESGGETRESVQPVARDSARFEGSKEGNRRDLARIEAWEGSGGPVEGRDSARFGAKIDCRQSVGPAKSCVPASEGRNSRRETARFSRQIAPLVDVDRDTDIDQQTAGRENRAGRCSREFERYRKSIYRAWRERTGKSGGFKATHIEVIRRWWSGGVPIRFAVELIQRDPKVRRSILWYEERVLERWGGEEGVPPPSPAEVEDQRRLAEAVGVVGLDGKDRELYRQMQADGVPVDLMIEVVVEVRRKRAGRGLEAAFTLRWYRWDIQRRWLEHQRLQAPAWMPEPEETEPSVADSLEQLVTMLPEELPARAWWGERIRRLESGENSFSEVEQALEDLDREMVGELWSQADGALRSTVEDRSRQAEWRLEPMLEEDRERLLERIQEQLVRERFEAPVLSLHSVAAI